MQVCILCHQEFNDPRSKKGLCVVCYLRCCATDKTDIGYAKYATDDMPRVGRVCYSFPASNRSETDVFLRDIDIPGPIPIDIAHTCVRGYVFITE